ncbi:MAG: hypothetical protein ACK5LC_09395 [Coprobacillaceae bacterium]
MNNNTKQILLDTTKQLLLECEDVSSITARVIATKANVNLAMINYCYQSKDNLLSLATSEIIRNDFEKYDITKSDGLNTKEQLLELLVYISEVVMKYKEITQATIPHILLNAPITLPNRILPYIKECLINDNNDKKCRTIAFQIVTNLQIIFYRFSDYCEYIGVNINNEEEIINEIRENISLNLDAFLGGDESEK